jgi:hypothetical protein
MVNNIIYNFLVKITNNGCSDTAVKEVIVWPTPKANFTIDKFSQCLSGNSFTFTDTSSLPIWPVDILWDFGDSSSSSVTNPTKSFLNPSAYKVKLKVTSNTYYLQNYHECIDTISKIINVHPQPNVGFIINKDTQCINGNSFNLTDTTKITTGSFSKLWNLGTSVSDTSTKSMVNKVYNNVNSYKIKYMATSNFGCKDSLEKTVTILPSPAPAGAIAGPISNLQTAISYLYNINQQTGVNYKWIVSNAAIVNGQGTNAVTLQWINNGIGKLTVIITNASGCTDTSYLNVEIGKQPSIINFIPTSAKTGTTVTISGINLNGATSVKFGGVNAQSFNIDSFNQITAVVGTGATGDVTITTPNGTATLSGFTYLTNTRLESINLLNGLKIYPNPAKDELIISTIQKLNGSHIIIIDMIGRKIIEETVTNVSNQHTILVSELKTGAYILSIQKEGEISRIKFVKE